MLLPVNSNGYNLNMTKLLLPIIFLISLVNISLAQDCKTCLTKKDVLQDKTKATVYIALERIEKDEVLVRVYNNTPWAITFATYLDQNVVTKYRSRLCDGQDIVAPPDKFEVDAKYQIEILPPPSTIYEIEKLPSSGNSKVEDKKPKKEEPPLPRVMYPDVGGSDTALLSGRSLLFRIKRDHLIGRVRVYLPYSYEWETEERGGYPWEPQHRVYFYAYEYGLDKKR